MIIIRLLETHEFSDEGRKPVYHNWCLRSAMFKLAITVASYLYDTRTYVRVSIHLSSSQVARKLFARNRIFSGRE